MIRLRGISVLCYIVLCNVIFYNTPSQSRRSGSWACRGHLDGHRIFTKSSQETPCVPTCKLKPWCTLKIIFYVQTLGTPMSLEHFSNSKRASYRNSLNKYLWVHSSLMLPLWCGCFDSGLQDILSWLKKHTIKRVLCHLELCAVGIRLVAGPGVYVNVAFVCFPFDVAVLVPGTFITSYGSCQNVCFKYLLASLKYQPCAWF